MAAVVNGCQFVFILLASFIYDASCQDRVGCFVDASSRVLPSRRADNSMTVEWCLDSCFKDSFAFAGVEAGRECFCGNSTDHAKHGVQRNDDECSWQCRGNRSQTCGGGWRLEIYKDRNECLENNNGGCNHKCVNSLGSYHCTCHAGYALMVGEKMTCTDIDECSLDSQRCNQNCTNTAGGYNCSCMLGYNLVGNEIYTCTDIDECSLATNECNQNCSNTEGGYNCSCMYGYDMAEDELYTCKDINECTDGSHICNQTCKNTPGAYECSCDIGYEMIEDSSHECTDVNECNASNGGCDHSCINSLGSYQCECRDGYILKSPNGPQCEEISSGKSENMTGMAAGIAVAGFCAVLIIIVVVFIIKRRQSKRLHQTREELFPATSSSTCHRTGAYENVSIAVDEEGIISSDINVYTKDSRGKRSKIIPQDTGSTGSTQEVLTTAEPQQLQNDDETKESPPHKHSNIIPVQDMDMYIEDIMKDSASIETEFKGVMASYGEYTDVMGREWKLKNKYKNIMPYEHNRVRLTENENPYSDYINASYIKFPNSVATAIAAQGPIQETIGDFWRMIWEQDIRIIVMLTNVIENMKRKCAHYWPDTDKISVDKYTIRLTSVAEFPDYVIRVFEIYLSANPSNKRRVQHFQFTAWPDKDVPHHTAPFLRFNHKIKTANVSEETIVVHCSAGVGRTGTFIALNRLLSLVPTNQGIDALRCLRELREQRTDMIQTVKQYIFLHIILRDAIAVGDTAISACNLATVYANSQVAQLWNGTADIHRQYEIILRVPSLTMRTASAGNKPCNKDRNRTSILPSDARRVFLKANDSDYINAVRIVGYKKNNDFIATQWPLDSTVDDFWKMIQDNNIKAVVVLEDMAQITGYPRFLPSRDITLKAGDVYVHLVGEMRKVQTIGEMRVMLSNNAQSPTDKLYSNIEILQSADQTGHKVDVLSMDGPLTVEQVSILTERMKGLNLESTPTVVMSRDGGQLCGLYVVVNILLQMLEKEKEIDVFYAAHQVKSYRPEFFSSEESYKQLHEMMKTYCERHM